MNDKWTGVSLSGKQFKLLAKVSTNSPALIKPIVEKFIGSSGTVVQDGQDFVINALLEGESAKDLNRALLSEMRRSEKKTRLRSEWTSSGEMESFFDYVSKSKKAVK